MNDELCTMFEQDQADRQGELHPDIGKRDDARRTRVEELIAADALQDPEDYFHAAMVFQHGQRLEHFWRARAGAEGGRAEPSPAGALACRRRLRPLAYAPEQTAEVWHPVSLRRRPL